MGFAILLGVVCVVAFGFSFVPNEDTRRVQRLRKEPKLKLPRK